MRAGARIAASGGSALPRSPESGISRPARRPRMAILETSGLVKYYGRRKVVDGVSYTVDAGEVVGLLGPNGAGKTTSFRMTTGQITPYDGKVVFNGQDVTRLPMYRRARLGMGYLSQEQSVFRKLSVEQNILAVLEMLPTSRSLGRKLTRSERWERTEQVIDQFGLQHVRNNKAARCSGGEKRRPGDPPPPRPQQQGARVFGRREGAAGGPPLPRVRAEPDPARRAVRRRRPAHQG